MSAGDFECVPIGTLAELAAVRAERDQLQARMHDYDRIVKRAFENKITEGCVCTGTRFALQALRARPLSRENQETNENCMG